MIEWINKPRFEVLDDGNYNRFVCTKAGRVVLGNTPLEFPVGWVTDFTTGNVFTRIFLPQLGPHTPAALIHDRLLDLGQPRAEARKWMRLQLDLLPKVKRHRRILMPLGVRVYDLVIHRV